MPEEKSKPPGGASPGGAGIAIFGEDSPVRITDNEELTKLFDIRQRAVEIALKEFGFVEDARKSKVEYMGELAKDFPKYLKFLNRSDAIAKALVQEKRRD